MDKHTPIDRAAFALTPDRMAEMAARFRTADIKYQEVKKPFDKERLARARAFTPIVLSLIAGVGQVTHSAIFTALSDCGVELGDGIWCLANDIIDAGVLDEVLLEDRPSSGEFADAVFKPTGRYANIAPA